MHETVEQRLLLASFRMGPSDDHQRTRQDLEMIGGSSRRGHPRFHVPIKAAGFLNGAAAAEYHFGGLGGELPPGLGGSGLDDDRPALDRPSDIQRPTHRQMLTFVVEDMHFLRLEENAARLVAQPRII